MCMKILFHADGNDEVATHQPSFEDRLRHTLSILEQETADGVEDWSETISRIKEMLENGEAVA